jgi:hypothetical protein
MNIQSDKHEGHQANASLLEPRCALCNKGHSTGEKLEHQSHLVHNDNPVRVLRGTGRGEHAILGCSL